MLDTLQIHECQPQTLCNVNETNHTCVILECLNLFYFSLESELAGPAMQEQNE